MQFQEMISPTDADEKIRLSLKGYSHVTLPISECMGRILSAPIIADRPQPPFDRVAMDGIAIFMEAYQSGIRYFKIQALQKAGEPAKKLIVGCLPQAGNELGPTLATLSDQTTPTTYCLEAMTGAVLPEGTDCIVPVEEIAIAEGHATLLEKGKGGREIKVPKLYGNIHRAGSDCAAGDMIVPAGITLTAQHLGAAAAFGYPRLSVAHMPKVAIVATGDELVDPAEQPLPYQIRRSNPYAIEAALRKRGFSEIALYHARDERVELQELLQRVLEDCEVLILSGGVSMGKTDYVPGVLGDLGITPVFHKIKHKPGKPFWFGMSRSQVPVFALPGNPASVLVCMLRYVLPALYRAMGGNEPISEMAVLAQDSQAPGTLTQFRPVHLSSSLEGRLMARWVPNQGSGDFSGWARSDGFVELPPGDEPLGAGQAVRLFRF